MRIAVTGATGYIGQRLVRLARQQGHEVLALSRRAPADPAVAWQRYALEDPGPPALPPGTGAVVHLAATTDPSAVDAQRELAAAQRLLAAAGQAGARLVFVSSQAAHAQAPSAYGRAKWQVEQACLAAAALAVRPGQVYGGPECGLFGVLADTARRSPLLPAFLPAPRIQPIHVDDVAAGLLACCTQQGLGGRLIRLADGRPESFTRLLRLIVQERVRSPRVFVPLPVAGVRLAARLAGPALRARLGLDRLLSLFSLQPMETAGDLRCLGLVLRPLESGMTRAGTARRLRLREARALLHYVLREAPGGELVRRHVRAVERLANGALAGLPGWMLRHPRLIALDDGARRSRQLAWHLQAATVIAEASPQGARCFLARAAQGGAAAQCLRLVRAALAEGCWRTLGTLRSALRRRLPDDRGAAP